MVKSLRNPTWKIMPAQRGDGAFGHSIRHDHLLITPAEWIVRIGAKRRNALKTAALIEGDGLALVDPRLEADDAQPMRPRVRDQTVEHESPESPAAQGRTHVHAFDLGILVRDE